MPKSISREIQTHMLIYQPHLHTFYHKGHWMLALEIKYVLLKVSTMLSLENVNIFKGKTISSCQIIVTTIN